MYLLKFWWIGSSVHQLRAGILSFQILFVHQKTLGTHNSGQFTHQSGLEQETANFDLVLNVRESLDYFGMPSDLQRRSVRGRNHSAHGQRLELLFRTCASVPDRAISQMDILLPAERQKILNSFVKPNTCRWNIGSIYAIVSSYAVSTPTQVAVRQGAEHMTYSELERRANRMARYLISLGVGPEMVIGWCVERTWPCWWDCSQ